MMFVTHLFVSSCNWHTLDCTKFGSITEDVVKPWDYFEQEGRKSKVSGGEEERNLEARPLSSSQLGLVFILLRCIWDFRVKVRMKYCKKGRFSMLRKRFWSKYRFSWIYFDADSLNPCNHIEELFIVWQERSISLTKILVVEVLAFITLNPLFATQNF